MKANFDSRLKALEEETAKHGNLNVCLATKRTELHLGCFLLVKSVILTSKFKIYCKVSSKSRLVKYQH